MTKLTQKIKNLSTATIEATLVYINKPWNMYTQDERQVRADLLKEYETRNGGDALDALMDALELAAA